MGSRRNHSARAERQGHTQQGGINDRAERRATQIAAIQSARHECVHHTRQQESEQQVWRHFIYKSYNLTHRNFIFYLTSTIIFGKDSRFILNVNKHNYLNYPNLAQSFGLF